MCQEVKLIASMLDLPPIQLYWLLAQSYHLVLCLFPVALANLRHKQVDERGLYRLNQSLRSVKQEFDLLLRKTKEVSIDELEQRNAKQLEKVQFVLELFTTRDV
jgi:hypothetical protein